MSDTTLRLRGALFEHARRPRNQGYLGDADLRGSADDSICGDHISVTLRSRGLRIERAAFEARACALCRAAASMMTEAVRGKSPAQALSLRDAFIAMLSAEAAPGAVAGLGELRVFEALRQLPSRKHCAILPWTALSVALAPRLAPNAVRLLEPEQVLSERGHYLARKPA